MVQPISLSNFTGTWSGTISINDVAGLRVVLRVWENETKELTATLDSPDQGAVGIPVGRIRVEEGILKFSLESLGAEFEGALDASGKSTSGDWKQRGVSLPLTLTNRGADALVFNRPQVPREPFPYNANEVTFRSETQEITLAGTLTEPRSVDSCPAVLLISGSGAHDRDCTVYGHKPFLVIADYLARKGIATLRFDDRGVGGSTGTSSETTTAERAQDVLGGVRFLKNRDKIDSAAIGLLGHSEGGLVGAIAALRCMDVAFLLLMASPALPGEQTLEIQHRLIHERAGTPPRIIEWEQEFIREMHKVIVSGIESTTGEMAIRGVVQRAIDKAPEGVELKNYLPLLDSQVRQMKTPWYHFFLTYDPRPTLARVRCPVLSVIGSRDVQVPPSKHLIETKRVLEESGNASVTAIELPGLNHLFQTSHGETPAGYGEIEETISPTALETIGSWLFDRTGPRKI